MQIPAKAGEREMLARMGTEKEESRSDAEWDILRLLIRLLSSSNKWGREQL